VVPLDRPWEGNKREQTNGKSLTPKDQSIWLRELPLTENPRSSKIDGLGYFCKNLSSKKLIIRMKV
jgi:hypothetical protein